jgi:hypothetical protein
MDGIEAVAVVEAVAVAGIEAVAGVDVSECGPDSPMTAREPCLQLCRNRLEIKSTAIQRW